MAKIEQSRPLLNPDNPLTTGVKAALLTGSVASIIALAKLLGEAKRQADKEKERQRKAVSGNTIVFNLRKKGEDGSCDGCDDCKGATSVSRVESLVEKEVKPSTADTQLRETNGRFTDINSKTAGYIENTLNGTGHILAALGGGAAGYYVVTRIAQKAEQNRLKKQIAAAQQEYLDLLDGRSVKNAEAFCSLFSMDGASDEAIAGIEKQAGIFKDTIGAIKGGTSGAKHVSSAALAAYLLLAGGSAWATKKLLEKRFDPPEEEEPEETPRIIMKAGSAEFEIQPEHMMATIGIMRDCIADSMSDLEKRAANYGFLDEISKNDEGRQWLLDLYARKNGLGHENPLGVKGYKPSEWTLLKYSRTLGDVMKHPDKHSDAINAHVMKMMGKDPEGWFRLLGDKRNSDIVSFKANEAIGNMSEGKGFSSWLAGVPIIGDLFKNFMRWYVSNSKYGRKAVARRSLAGMGITGDRADSILDKFDFSSSGWTPKSVGSGTAASTFLPSMNGGGNAIRKAASSEKKADMLHDVIAMTAQTKTLSDKSNKDILRALEELKRQNGIGSAKKKRKAESDQYVEFSPEVEAMLSPEAKRKILAAFAK